MTIKEQRNHLILLLSNILNDELDGCPMCDGGVLRKSAVDAGKDHWDDCVWNNAKNDLAKIKVLVKAEDDPLI